MSKKITPEEFLQRFKRSYPDSEIELLNYTGISNKLGIKCKKCGKTFTKTRAREFLKSFSCCGAHNETKREKLEKIYAKSKEFDFVKVIDRNYFIVHHNTCGNDLKRTFSAALDNPFACKYCETIKKSNMRPMDDVQQEINERFNNTIQILEYTGQLKQCTYKCLKCGLIFKEKQICLMQSRGCPKCDRYKSMGERFIKKLLEDNNLIFEEQIGVKELPLQKFDFCVYKDGSPQYYIEVQGEQHFEKREIFKDSLKKIQERDERKREYCRKNNIPLYELIYRKGKFLNLDILPLSSTTISAKESTP